MNVKVNPKERDESQRPTGGNSSHDFKGIDGRGLCQNRPVTWALSEHPGKPLDGTSDVLM